MQGLTGFQGLTGLQGRTGLQGLTGLQGKTGVASSDIRLKREITDYKKGLNAIEGVHTVKFKWNGMWESEYAHDDEYIDRIGVIAQEIEAVLPDAVSKKSGIEFWAGGPKQEVYQISVDVITYTLVNAVKELSLKNKELAQRVKKLEEKNDRR